MDRFKYHFEPQKGWMNDPNGLIEYKGLYHFFYQHYPHDTKWGPMHWGHVTSKDLISFKEEEIALFPDMDYEDDGGCFSGSAIEKDGKLFLFYTSVSKKYGQTQSMAISEDGFHFYKYEGNPIIREFPKAEGSADFRDPKVFAFGNEYRMIIGSRYNEKGRVLIYESKDLFNWNYLGIMYESKEYSNAIECPDLFKLGDKWVLMFSKIGQAEYATQFIIGEFDGFKFKTEKYQSVEAGPQFYAPQTFLDSRGRRLMVGWFYDWKRPLDEGAVAAGALAVTRELSLCKGEIYAYPVKEATQLLRKYLDVTGIELITEADKIVVTNGNDTIRINCQIESVEILSDVKAVEIFINHGQKNISMWRLNN